MKTIYIVFLLALVVVFPALGQISTTATPFCLTNVRMPLGDGEGGWTGLVGTDLRFCRDGEPTSTLVTQSDLNGLKFFSSNANPQGPANSLDIIAKVGSKVIFRTAGLVALPGLTNDVWHLSGYEVGKGLLPTIVQPWSTLTTFGSVQRRMTGVYYANAANGRLVAHGWSTPWPQTGPYKIIWFEINPQTMKLNLLFEKDYTPGMPGMSGLGAPTSGCEYELMSDQNSLSGIGVYCLPGNGTADLRGTVNIPGFTPEESFFSADPTGFAVINEGVGLERFGDDKSRTLLISYSGTLTDGFRYAAIKTVAWRKNDKYYVTVTDGNRYRLVRVPLTGGNPEIVTVITEDKRVIEPSMVYGSGYSLAVRDSRSPSSLFHATLPTTTIILTGTLSDGTVGQPYTGRLTATGGKDPYRFLTSRFDLLPPGLSLNTDGTFTGSPATAGTYTFPITVTDANNVQSAAVNATVKVAPQTVQGPTIAAINSNFSGFEQYAPGMATSLYGTGFGRQTDSAKKVPLATALGETFATFDGSPMALFYVSATQVNAQMPPNATIGKHEVRVVSNGIPSAPRIIEVSDVAPDFVTYVPEKITLPSGVSKIIATLDVSGVTVPTIKGGNFYSLYGTGLGVTNPMLASGEAASGPTPIVATCTIKFNGEEGQIAYAGAAPTFPALYQINVRTPDNLSGNHGIIRCNEREFPFSYIPE